MERDRDRDKETRETDRSVCRGRKRAKQRPERD